MHRLFSLLVILGTLIAPLSADQMFLRDNLSRANVGDFLVTDQNRTQTVLIIAAKDERVITIQEVSIPEGCFPSGLAASWREWVQKGAPGHTSWVAYEIDPHDGALLESFSYTKNSWCDIPRADSFLSTLFNLPLTLMPDQSRRRVGGNDRRRVWQPKLTVDGQVIPNAPFRSWRGRWPNDGTELGGKLIEAYLPTEEGKYPSYFPYCLQVTGGVGKARMRIIDSGTGLRPPVPLMPQRPLAFTNNGRMEEGHLRLWLKTRPQYTNLTLVAIEAGDLGKVIPLPFSVRPTQDPDVVLIEIPEQALAEKLAAGKSYRFSMQPWNRPQCAAETRDPIHWDTHR